MWLGALVSTLIVVSGPAPRAHEVEPAILQMEQAGAELRFELRMALESVVAGVDLSEVTDSNDAPQADTYDALRALGPDALAARFDETWPAMAGAIRIETAAGARLAPELGAVEIPPVGNPELLRLSRVTFTAQIPPGAESVTFGWAPELGPVVVRQEGVEAPYSGFLQGGVTSPRIALAPRGGLVGGMDWRMLGAALLGVLALIVVLRGRGLDKGGKGD